MKKALADIATAAAAATETTTVNAVTATAICNALTATTAEIEAWESESSEESRKAGRPGTLARMFPSLNSRNSWEDSIYAGLPLLNLLAGREEGAAFLYDDDDEAVELYVTLLRGIQLAGKCFYWRARYSTEPSLYFEISAGDGQPNITDANIRSVARALYAAADSIWASEKAVEAISFIADPVTMDCYDRITCCADDALRAFCQAIDMRFERALYGMPNKQ